MASTINAKNTSSGLVLTPDASGQLELQTADTTRMTIDSSGNVGIGASAGGQRLLVSSSATGTTAGSNVIIRLQSEAAGRDATLQFSDNVSNSATVSMVSGATIFRQNGSEAMRIDSSGKVLINTTSTVGSTAWINNKFNGASETGIAIQNTFASNTGTFVQFFNSAAAQIGTISQNGASAVAYNTSSDYRLKENVQPMQNALDTIFQLNPVTYTWKVDGSDGQGFIAHELQAVVPDCVTGTKDEVDEDGNPIYQGVDTSFLVATLTKAIQELKAIVDEQAEKIKALEAK